MPNNLFISFKVNNNELNGEKIRDSIQSLGNSTKLFENSWYVNSPSSTDEAMKTIGSTLTKDDSVVICNCSDNTTVWANIGEKEAQRVRQNWRM